MKKFILVIGFILLSMVCCAQLQFRLLSDSLITKSLVVAHQENHPVNLHLKKDNGPKITATALYLGLNGIVTLNQLSSPPNVQRDLRGAYIGTIVLTSVAYVIFLSLY